MKKVYYYDSNYQWSGWIDVIYPNYNGEYELPKNSTDVPIPEGLYQPITFNIEKGEWSGVTQDQFLKNNPVEENTSDIDLVKQIFQSLNVQITALRQQVALIPQLQAEIEKLKSTSNVEVTEEEETVQL